MLTSTQLRTIRSEFRRSKHHVELPEVSLIADKDSTALFNVAGMQPLIPYLMGKEHPLGKRLFDIQKCVRTVDIAEVGDASHLTFFEMMGNRSLGDYFKKEAVAWSREFLTKYLEIDPKKLAVTVFEWDEFAPRDEETAWYRKETGIAPDKISYLPADNNWWSPWPVGPCGPDTEIYYRVGESEFPPLESNVRDDEENRLEIRNNVFMEYYRDESWTLSKLSKQNVDTGMGFERMCKVLQSKESVYDTDLFASASKGLDTIIANHHPEEETSPQQLKRVRIILDHTRTAFMLINDGLIPSNVGAGYVLRMIIRRFVYNFYLYLTHTQSSQKPTLELYKKLIEQLLDSFKDLRTFDTATILRVLTKEVENFLKTIENGFWMLDTIMLAGKQGWDVVIDGISVLKNGKVEGEFVFRLYDSYGFPIELTKEFVAGQWLTIDEKSLETALEAAKEKSRQATKEMFKKGRDWSKYLEGIPQTEFMGYTALSSDTPKLLKTIELETWQQVLIFDKTPFYPEMGGQMGDIGTLIGDDGKSKKITNVQKFAGVILHFVE